MKQIPVNITVSHEIAADIPSRKIKHTYIHISCLLITLALSLYGFSLRWANHLCADIRSWFSSCGIGDTSIEDLKCRMGHHQPADLSVVYGLPRLPVESHTSGILGFHSTRFGEVFATGLTCTNFDRICRFCGTALIPLVVQNLSLPLTHYSAMFAVGKKLVNHDFAEIS